MGSLKTIRVIIPGGLNTDIIGLGVDTLLGPGELTLGGTLQVGPGGKARNMAQMAAAYLGKGKVAMIGRTSQDPLGLWKIPYNTLQQAGVDTGCIKKLSFKQAKGKYPGIALIPVDKKGKNQIYVLPGVNQDFGKQDIDRANGLFANPDLNKVMIMALEIPFAAAQYCINRAYKNNIRVVLDPGGISGSIRPLLNRKLFLLKPNEHEAKIIAGVTITGFSSAKKAADKMKKMGIQNILITHGAKGAYLFTPNDEEYIRVPAVKKGRVRDETGCGDQVTAIVGAGLAQGKPLTEAARLAVKAGTLQFYRSGIQPVRQRELRS